MPTQAPPSALTCKDVTRHATNFLESRLSSEQAAGVLRHLERCSACRTYVDQIALVRDTMHALPGESTPEKLKKKLRDTLRHKSAP